MKITNKSTLIERTGNIYELNQFIEICLDTNYTNRHNGNYFIECSTKEEYNIAIKAKEFPIFNEIVIVY